MARRKKKTEESIEENLEQSQDAVLSVEKEEPKEEPKEESKEESKEEPKEEPKEEQKKSARKNPETIKNELMEEYADAIEWMTTLHEGDVDKIGVPYWTHPMAVAIRVKSLAKQAGVNVKLAVVSALLHDVVEDGHASIKEVEARYGKDVAKVVGILTRDPKLSYMEYIKEIVASASKSAMIVKYADLLHNTSPRRLANLSTQDRARLTKKYEPAKRILENAFPLLKSLVLKPLKRKQS